MKEGSIGLGEVAGEVPLVGVGLDHRGDALGGGDVIDGPGGVDGGASGRVDADGARAAVDDHDLGADGQGHGGIVRDEDGQGAGEGHHGVGVFEGERVARRGAGDRDGQARVGRIDRQAGAAGAVLLRVRSDRHWIRSLGNQGTRRAGTA
ncbi:MAG: hypothetical protein EBW87_04015 [Burkholderiaceae bacterium]|nr:hypothetical protein [Burkholderiaceae bacterium]